MEEKIIRSFESRLVIDALGLQVFAMMAGQYSHIMHTLFAEIQAGNDPVKCKSSYLEKQEITGWQFNAILNQLKGKIDSCKERLPQLIEEKKERIHRLQKKIARYEKNEKKRSLALLVHQKKRKLYSLQEELKQLEQDKKRRESKDLFWL